MFYLQNKLHLSSHSISHTTIKTVEDFTDSKISLTGNSLNSNRGERKHLYVRESSMFSANKNRKYVYCASTGILIQCLIRELTKIVKTTLLQSTCGRMSVVRITLC